MKQKIWKSQKKNISLYINFKTMKNGIIIASNAFLGIVGIFVIVALLVIVEFAQGAPEDFLGAVWYVCWFLFLYFKTKIEIYKNQK